MNAETLIALTIARRTTAGLSLKAYGAEGYTTDRPFTCHAKDAAQADRWRTQLAGRGYTVEVL